MKSALFSTKSIFLAVIALSLELATPQLGVAQASTAPPASPTTEVINGKVYTFVEQMPQLPGGGGSAAVVSAIQSKVVYPAQAIQQQLQGRVFVNFTVGADGLVHDTKVVKGLGAGCDEAVLAAVQQLPRFIPGKQAGRPVSVSFTVPVTFRLVAPAPTATLPADSTKRVYTSVERMPELPGGGGKAAIVATIQRQVRYPADALRSHIEGRVFVSFNVLPDGSVRDAQIVKGIGGGCDEEVLNVVKRLPRFTPGMLNGRLVTVNYTLPITFAIQ